MNTDQEKSSTSDGKPNTADIQQEDMDKKKKERDELADVQSKGLDDLVNVNSLFTIAVFIGLASANPNTQTLDPKCLPDPIIAKKLIFYEVVSFGFFLVSSLSAKSLKILINFHKIKDQLVLYRWVRIFLEWYWRKILLLVSFWSSVAGILTLTISMVNLVQIRIGRMHCGSIYTERSIQALIIMDTIALSLLYLPPFLIASFARYEVHGKGWRQLLKKLCSES